MFHLFNIIWSWLIEWNSDESEGYPSIQNYICIIFVFNIFQWVIMTKNQ